MWTAVCHVCRVSPLASELLWPQFSSRHLVIISQRWLQLLFRSANNHIPSDVTIRVCTIAIDDHVDRSSPCFARFLKPYRHLPSFLFHACILSFLTFLYLYRRNWEIGCRKFVTDSFYTVLGKWNILYSVYIIFAMFYIWHILIWNTQFFAILCIFYILYSRTFHIIFNFCYIRDSTSYVCDILRYIFTTNKRINVPIS